LVSSAESIGSRLTYVPVEAADVDDVEFAPFPPEFGVAAADGNVVEEDVAAGMAACGCDRLIQGESGTGVGAALNNEHRRVVGKVGADTRDGVRDDFLRHVVVVRVGHLLFLVDCSRGVAQISGSENLRFGVVRRTAPGQTEAGLNLSGQFVMR
jgi:hypothetical protein